MENFEQQFRDALNVRIPQDHDGYTELQYSDELYVHVGSHPDGEGHFEITVIVPHDTVNPDVVSRDHSTLPEDVPGVEQLYDDLEQLIEEVTGEKPEDFVFYLTEVVDDGVWERPATMYDSFKLSA